MRVYDHGVYRDATPAEEEAVHNIPVDDTPTHEDRITAEEDRNDEQDEMMAEQLYELTLLQIELEGV